MPRHTARKPRAPRRGSARLLAILGGLLLAGHPATAPALQDPMRPPALQGGPQRAPARSLDPAPDLMLNSTLVGGDRRVAVINGAPVGVGDTVLGAEVLAIEARTARLRYRGRELLLRLGTQAPGITRRDRHDSEPGESQ